jgi:adenylate cyclase
MATAAKSTTPGLSRPPAGDLPRPEAARPKGGFSRQLYRKLITIYVQGSIVAVGVCFFLFFLGLEFTGRQWMFFLVSITWGMTLYVAPDIYLIHRNYQRLGRALTKIDRGEIPPPDEVTGAMVRALNLPMYAFTRITFLHGPGAALAGLIMTYGGNYLFDAQFQQWQIWTLFTIVFFFASPTHGIFEFFSVSRAVAPALERLSGLPGGDISSDEQKARLRSTSLRRKLLYLAIFVTALPLVFFAASIGFKVTQLIGRMGVVPGAGQLPALWLWVAGVVFICMTTTIIMVILTAGEVSRSAAKLLDGMKSVERGDHNVHLRITSTDEYADLFRGFNLMTEGLREEAKILGLSQDLMGELQLDPLLERIMRATTELLDAERSTLFIYDRKTKELWSRFAEGLGKKEIRIPRDQGIAGSVFTSGKTENIADPYADARFNQSVDRATGFRTRCILAMPVLNKAGQPIGVVEVLNKRGGQFSLQDENRLRAFSAQAAICLENARLFDEVIQIRDYNESILRSTSNGMLALDAKGVITSANPAALEMFGGGTVDLGMLLGQNAANAFRDKNAWVMASIAKVASTGETDLSPDADLHRPNGEVASVNMTAVPLREADQTVVGTLLIFEDLSSEKRQRTMMSLYMSKEVVDELLASGTDSLEGREQEVSILFSDICNFTTISEAIGPQQTVSMLNDYFSEMFEVIEQHGGMLDKYIGDAIMALFGAPFVRRGDADRALRAACDLVHALKRFNVRWVQAGNREIRTGIGLNTGPTVLGTIGSPKRMGYTAIGDSVNLASRLEAATRMYDIPILVAQPTLGTLIEKHPVREIDLLRVKGKLQPVAVYEALGYLAAERIAELESAHAAFAEGLSRYRAREFRNAMDAFHESSRLRVGDRPSELYIERCQHYLTHAPPDEWDCVWTLKEK